MQRQPRGAAILLAIVFAVIITFALFFRDGNVSLTGSAVIDTPDGGSEGQEVGQADSASENAAVQDTAAQDNLPPTAVPASPIPLTDIPPTDIPPTDVPPTDIPPTEIPPTDVPPEATAAPTDPSAEPIAEVTASPEETEIPAATPDSTAEAEVTAEVTLEPELTAEATAEFTPEATEEPAAFEILVSCTPAGATFTITNLGTDMLEPGIYAIDGVESGEVLLASGASQTIQAGYDIPSLSFEGIDVQPETPCTRPADLSVATECSLEAGVTFAVTNTGGAMQVEEEYSIEQTSGEIAIGTLLLGEGEILEIPAGYGSPIFTSGELNAQNESVCEPPAHVEGRVWLDLNADGAYSDDEPGSANVIVELVSSDDFAVQTITLEDGHYDFFPVSAGDFTVRLQSDSLPLDTEASSDPDGDNDGQTSLLVAPGETYSLSFGYAPIGNASIEGAIWLETSNFGIRDVIERGLTNVMVQLTDVTGTVIAEMVVGLDGVYRFEDLGSGNYMVRLVAQTLPQPYGITFNRDNNYDLETSVSIESSEQAVTGLDFGVVGTF